MRVRTIRGRISTAEARRKPTGIIWPPHRGGQGQERSIPSQAPIQCNSTVQGWTGQAAGVGAGRLPISLVSHDLAAGTLVHLGDVDGPEIALWTLYPSLRLLSARVSAFLDFLKDAFPTGTPDELAVYVDS